MLQTIPICAPRRSSASCSAAIPAAIPIGCALLQRRVAYGERPGSGTGADLPSGAPAWPSGALDFTNGGGLAVTIAGAPFPHLPTISGSPSAAGNTSRRSAAARASPRSPRVSGSALAARRRAARHRTDRLSAAYRNLSSRRTRRRATPSSVVTTAWSDPQQRRRQPRERLGRGRAGHLKTGLGEALELRGSRDSPTWPPTRPSSRSHRAQERIAARRARGRAPALFRTPAPDHGFSTATSR